MSSIENAEERLYILERCIAHSASLTAFVPCAQTIVFGDIQAARLAAFTHCQSDNYPQSEESYDE